MTDFAPLIGALTAHKAPSELTLAPSTTNAEWERCALVYQDVEFSDDVRDLYGVANGFETGWVEPFGARWAPLPIEPPMWGISWTAPCRPEAQLPIIDYSGTWLTMLLEGEHKGEIWAAISNEPGMLGFAARVARTLEELFEHLTIAADGAIEGKFITDAQSAGELYPGINTFLLTGSDLRPQEQIKADGGWPPIYQSVTSPEWEQAWYELRAREEAWQRGVIQWRQRHFSGQKTTPAPI